MHVESIIDSNVEKDRVEYADEDKCGKTKGFAELTGRGSTKVISNVIAEKNSGLFSSSIIIRNKKNNVKIA